MDEGLHDIQFILGMHKIKGVLPNALLRFPAQLPRHGVALKTNGPIRIQNGDEIKRVLGKMTKISLAPFAQSQRLPRYPRLRFGMSPGLPLQFELFLETRNLIGVADGIAMHFFERSGNSFS